LETSKQPQRVLIVDENRDAADTLALLLTQAGHDVRVSYDGGAALAAARQWGPDVIVLDLYMPGMDGFEVARRLRAEAQFASVLIVALTGASGDEDRQRSREAGIDHYLVKPVDLEFIESLLGRAR
jgi:CheY-like chemotaxis protein